MKQNIFFMFLDILNAARNGRYMHGNGRYWYIVSEYGTKVVLDTIDGTTNACPDYDGTPRTDMDTVYSIERFLKAADKQDNIPCEYDYYTAKDIVRKAVQENNLLFTNGHQWYIKVGTHGVAIVPLGILTDKVTIEVMDCHSSWVYMQSNARPCILSDATKKYMNF